jgi:riboflavin synthase
MFSGIVADLGMITAVSPRGNGCTLVVQTGFPVGGEEGIALGDSIAVNGVCLTAESLQAPDRFTVAAGKETLDCTTMGGLEVGDRVHLERALQVNARLDGHIVSGHVDGVGHVRSTTKDRESVVVWIEAPPGLARYIAKKGSVTVDGVSMTVNEVDETGFKVGIIPYTAEHTTLSSHPPGGAVNIEVDMLARYLERMLQVDSVAGGIAANRLEALGFEGPGKGEDT